MTPPVIRQSDDGKYRYWLRADLQDVPAPLTATFVTFGAQPIGGDPYDAPDVARVVEMAKQWNAGRVYLTSVYQFVAQGLSDVLNATEPRGPDWRSAFDEVLSETHMLVLAWGNMVSATRARPVLSAAKRFGLTPFCLAVNDTTGQPTALQHFHMPDAGCVPQQLTETQLKRIGG